MLPVSFHIGDVIDDVNSGRDQTEDEQAFQGFEQGRQVSELAVENERRQDEGILWPLAWAHCFEDVE
jgi:hypothetical protein